MEIDLSNLLVVAGVAVLAPVLADLSRRARCRSWSPRSSSGSSSARELLGLAELDGFIDALSTFGLAFLFFLAGIEIDFERIRGAPARAGVVGWLLSVGARGGRRARPPPHAASSTRRCSSPWR